MFVRSRIFHSNICIACKDNISSQNKSHTHTHPPSKLIQLCHLLGQGRASAALSSSRSQPRGQSPHCSPRGDRWLIKREITSTTVTPNQSEDLWLRQDTIMRGSSTPACLKQRYGFQCLAHAFDQTLCYFRMGLSNT